MRLNLIKTSAITTIIVATLGFSTASRADGSAPNPYSDCGLGAAIFQDIGWAAAISNVIWDLGITAITSGLSSPETCNGHTAETAQFILDTYDQVVADTVNGGGEYTTSALSLLGCDTSVHPAMVADIRNQIHADFAKADYTAQSDTEKAQGYFAAAYVLANNHYKSSCQAS